MAREIDVLLDAAAHGWAVVEKDSHLLWSAEELRRARTNGSYPDEDALAAPTDETTIAGPFPGCMQQLAAPPELSEYRHVGQTEHFVILCRPGEEWAEMAGCDGV